MAIRSASNPTMSAYFVFFIPTDEKQSPNIYIVVSVLPCNTDAVLPIKESGPCVFRILSIITSEEDEDIGLNMAKGTNDVG